jgi:hypothetical protein
MKPNFNATKKELWSVVTERVLTGVHGPLPKGVIPVPCLNTKGGIPPKWKGAFKRHKAKGRLDDWHIFISQERFGVVAMLEQEFGEAGESLSEKVRIFSGEVGLYLYDKYTPPRIGGDGAVHFSTIISWLLLGRPKNFYAELLYRCYLAGGAPCEWLGRYPKGRLIVYWPHKQEPEFA